MATRIFYETFSSMSLGSMPMTGGWTADQDRPVPNIVSSAADGIVGPLLGNRMCRVNWDGSVDESSNTSYESTKYLSTTYTNELFLRYYQRPDTNLDRTSGSATKFARFFTFQGSSPYNDMYDVLQDFHGARNEGNAGNTALTTYFGDTTNDNTCSSSAWHKMEEYFNSATGALRVWHDGILVRNDTGISFAGVVWSPWYISSNWSAAHDATNYMYFANIEFYSDSGGGTSSTGFMSSATIQAVTSAAGTSAPNISITTPPANWRTPLGTATVVGTASDDISVSSVVWQTAVSSGTASGTTSWTFTAPLLQSLTQFTITAQDGDGNTSSVTLNVTSAPMKFGNKYL